MHSDIRPAIKLSEIKRLRKGRQHTVRHDLKRDRGWTDC